MENNIPKINSLDSMEGVARDSILEESRKQEVSTPSTKNEELDYKKKLASQYEDFCIRAGDRMFNGEIINYLEFQLPPTKTVYTDENGKEVTVIKGGGLDFSKKDMFRYSDDEYFEELLNHPAFKEKINESDVFIDIGNGGNFALRVDADFLQRNGFKGKVLGIDPFRNTNEVNVSNGLHTEAIQQDGLSYMLGRPSGSGNVLCSNMEREIINNPKYAKALVEEIFRVIPENGLFICIHSDALYPIAKEIFPYSYEVNDNAYTHIFCKTEFSAINHTT